jgi:hypothetical protein
MAGKDMNDNFLVSYIHQNLHSTPIRKPPSNYATFVPPLLPPIKHLTVHRIALVRPKA